MKFKKRHIQAEVSKEKGVLTAIASTEVVDREGEKLLMRGWEMDNFIKNPVLLWGHDHSQLPIGRANNLKVAQVNKKKALVFEPEFHSETPLARAVGRLFELGILKSFSVGFIPKERDGDTFTKQELIEISAVNVPANHEAQVLSFAKSLEDKEEIKAIKNHILSLDSEEDELRAEIEQKDLTILELEKTIASKEQQIAALQGELVKASKRSKEDSRKTVVRDILQATLRRIHKGLHELDK